MQNIFCSLAWMTISPRFRHNKDVEPEKDNTAKMFAITLINDVYGNNMASWCVNISYMSVIKNSDYGLTWKQFMWWDGGIKLLLEL